MNELPRDVQTIIYRYLHYFYFKIVLDEHKIATIMLKSEFDIGGSRYFDGRYPEPAPHYPGCFFPVAAIRCSPGLEWYVLSP